MNIEQAKTQIKDTVEAYLAKDELGLYRIPQSRQRPVFLLGAPGIGKTAIMTQIAQELEIGLVSYSMTHHTRQSALGLPFIVEESFEGTTYEASEYTMSEIVASIYDYMKTSEVRRGILFLDEINCVSETLYPSMLQFLQFKTFGRHKVPDDWVIVCAGNPPEYNKSVHEFDVVTLDRLRKIDVEPDYGTWRTYAVNQGVHPAILSFLEVKPDCFYRIETKPGEKSFVTARGWEDLSEVMALYEAMGKTVDANVIDQFLQDDDIAEKFALYYDLFRKYRADYQVESIFEGKADAAIVERARQAAFDERLALIGLLLDGMAARMEEVLDRERVLVLTRDVLREEKAAVVAGASVEETVGAAVARREADLARMQEAGLASLAKTRQALREYRLLKSLMAACELAGKTSGEAAFAVINDNFKSEVAALEPAAQKVSGQLDAVFAFMDEAFGEGREMLVFVTELTARSASSRFINRFGSESYYAHSDALNMDKRRQDLTRKVQSLLVDEPAAEGAPAAPSPSEAARLGDAVPVGPAGLAPIGAGGARAVQPDIAVEAALGQVPVPTEGELRAHYRDAAFEFGFAAMSKMILPGDLAGKTVLDVCCRRGKGVFKFSARVGESGRAIGVDWEPSYIDEARAKMDRAWHDNHLKRNNMEFRIAYPEDLLACGLGDESVDAVYVNSVLNLFLSPGQALKEMRRVLKRGGVFICQTVVASGPRDEAVRAAAAQIGNSVQAAYPQKDFEALCASVGFEQIDVVESQPVSPTTGFKTSHSVPIIENTEDVEFLEITYNMRF